MSIVMRIADSVAAQLSGIEIGGSSPATTVQLSPEIDFAKLTGKQIVVVPLSWQRSNADRAATAQTVKVGVCYIEKVTPGEAVDKMNNVETITEALSRKTLFHDGHPYAVITALEIDPVYASEFLRDNHVFFSLCSVTVKVIR